jgi:hypothetical protein
LEKNNPPVGKRIGKFFRRIITEEELTTAWEEDLDVTNVVPKFY